MSSGQGQKRANAEPPYQKDRSKQYQPPRDDRGKSSYQNDSEADRVQDGSMKKKKASGRSHYQRAN